MAALPVEYYSYEDYLQWEGEWELIDGIAYAMAPAPMFHHQLIAYEISFRLKEQLKNCPCFVVGEVDYKIDDYTVVRPDVVVVCERFERYIDKPPKLIVEVLSPSSKLRDEKVKFELYEKEGVEYYILVDPDTFEVRAYENSPKGYRRMREFLFRIHDCDFSVNFNEAMNILKEKR